MGINDFKHGLHGIGFRWLNEIVVGSGTDLDDRARGSTISTFTEFPREKYLDHLELGMKLPASIRKCVFV